MKLEDIVESIDITTINEDTLGQLNDFVDSCIEEASYQGNIGVMELIKAKQIAEPAIKHLINQMIEHGYSKRQIWKIIQQLTDTKLKGKQFR